MAYIIFGSALTSPIPQDIDIIPLDDRPVVLPEEFGRLPIDLHPELARDRILIPVPVGMPHRFRVMGSESLKGCYRPVLFIEHTAVSSFLRSFAAGYCKAREVKNSFCSSHRLGSKTSVDRIVPDGDYCGDGPRALSNAWRKLSAGQKGFIKDVASPLGMWGQLLLALCEGRQFSFGSDRYKGDPVYRGSKNEIRVEWTEEVIASPEALFSREIR